MGKISLWGLFSALVISLFTVRSDRIYTVCYRDSTSCYVYDSSDKVYALDALGVLTPLRKDVPIERKPILNYIPVHDQYSCESLTTNCYSMSFYDVCAYLTRLSENGFDVHFSTQTPDKIEGRISDEEQVFRFIVMSDDTFRIYPKDFATFSGSYPYLSEELK